MIVDRLETWVRDGMPTTPERIARAEAIVGAAARQAIGNFIPAWEPEARPKVTLSSHFYCPRQIHYALNGVEKEAPAPRAFDAFAIGQQVEGVLVAKCILAGLPVKWPDESGKQFRSSLEWDGDSLRGSVDMVLDIEGALIPVECKSMSEYGFDKAKKEGVEDTFGYVGQLQNYIAMLQAPYGIFVGVSKSTGHAFEQHVKPDPAHVARNRESYISAKRGLPERPGWATVKVVKAPGGAVTQIEAVACNYCAYKAACFPGYEQTVVSGKPVWRKPVEV